MKPHKPGERVRIVNCAWYRGEAIVYRVTAKHVWAATQPMNKIHPFDHNQIAPVQEDAGE